MAKQKKKTVLVVDDEELWLQAAKRIIRNCGFRAVTVSSGEEALQSLRRQSVDVLIADVRMPVMNGFDLFQKVRENPKWKNLPIVFMSALDDYNAKKFARELGASGYIEKPYTAEDLQHAMEEMLKKI